ncbi:MAG: hypothetical protein ABGZ35_25660, partial [Planctomycetaceae bacterium]
QMLQAAGLDPLTDEQRQADEDNPRGYFELEAATQLRDNPEWIMDAQGKVIKIVAQLIPWLPQGLSYRVIFMQRDIDEVLSSQRTMLERHGKQGSTLADDRMKNVFQRQLAQTREVLRQHQIPTLAVSHGQAIEDPGKVAARVANFVGTDVDTQTLAAAIDPQLYRQRKRKNDGPS